MTVHRGRSSKISIVPIILFLSISVPSEGTFHFSEHLIADGFRVVILPWVARSHDLLSIDRALARDHLPRAIYVYPRWGWDRRKMVNRFQNMICFGNQNKLLTLYNISQELTHFAANLIEVHVLQHVGFQVAPVCVLRILKRKNL